MSGQDMEELKMRSDARDSWLSSMFDRADINGDGFLDEDESLKLLTVSVKTSTTLIFKWKLQECATVAMNGIRTHACIEI